MTRYREQCKAKYESFFVFDKPIGEARMRDIRNMIDETAKRWDYQYQMFGDEERAIVYLLREIYRRDRLAAESVKDEIASRQEVKND